MIFLLAAWLLAFIPATAQNAWENGFYVHALWNRAIENHKTHLNDPLNFQGVTAAGGYRFFLVKGLFVVPEFDLYFESHDLEIIDALPPFGHPVTPNIDPYSVEFGVGVAGLAGYRIPCNKLLSLDIYTGPYFNCAIFQQQKQCNFKNKVFNYPSLRWRFGVGVNIWRLAIKAAVEVGCTKAYYDCREANTATLGIGYNF